MHALFLLVSKSCMAEMMNTHQCCPRQTPALQFFVATGDIPFMWIRDSAVQLGALVPRIPQRPALRLLVDGAVRTQVCTLVQCQLAMSECQLCWG